MSMIERAITTYDDRRGVDATVATIARAPAHIRAGINRARAARGLPVVLGAAESARIARADQLVREAAARQAIEPVRAWIDPGSSLAPRGVKPPARGLWDWNDIRTVTRVLVVGDCGIARCKATAGTVGEYVARGAYGSAAWINSMRSWCLVDGGHDGPAIEWAGASLRAIDCADVPLLVEWLPDMKIASHRAAVERIAAGHNAVSLRSVVRETRVQQLPLPTQVVLKAGLVHVALLDETRQAAYPGALAMLYRDKPATATELARQVKATLAASRSRAFAADMRARR